MKTYLKSKVTSFLVLMILLSFFSCKKDLEEIERFSSNDMIHENVRIIDSVSIGEPISISNDTYTFINHSDLSTLKVGDVIVGQSGKGYIRKITKISNQSDQIKLETEQAALTDVFERFLINDTIKIDFAEMKAYTKTQTAPVQISYIIPNANFKNTAGLVNLNNTVLIDEKIGNTNVLAKIVEGNINFQPEIIKHLDLSTNWLGIPNGIRELTIGTTGNLSMNFLAELSIDNNLAYNEEVSIVSFDIGPFWLGPVPFFVALNFDAGIVFNTQAEGNVQTGINSQASVTFGAQYQNETGWSTLWNKSLESGQLQTTWTANATSNAIVYVKPSVEVTIASIAGPYMDVKPDLVFDGQINPPTWNYNLISGIDGTLGFKVEIFSLSLADYNAELFRFDKVIASNSGQMTQVPTLTTEIITEITPTTAISGGIISSDGGADITAKGICWGANSLPNLENSVLQNGTGDESFSGMMTDLNPSTTYYVRAFATNNKGTAYGNARMFSTESLALLPTVTTSTVTNITETTAQGGGNVISDGGSTVTSRGICYSTSQNPTTSNFTVTSGSGTGTFTANMSGLEGGTIYYVRAYAVNSVGTAYGNEQSFTTDSPAGSPTVTTSAITNITETTAQGGGNVISDGGSTVTSRGICYSTSQNPTTSNFTVTSGSGTGTFTANMSGLEGGTIYYVRA
ncbi:MAG: hypothetical protein RBR87_14040, partial [Bacteroidales bacterium]|nr:hypothetical protein [Bacteroidales bacterium]